MMQYIEEVDSMPKGQSVESYRFEYEMILREFLDNEMKIAKVKKELIVYRSKPRKHNTSHLLVSGLKRTATRLNLPIKVIGRKGEVYLIRI